MKCLRCVPCLPLKHIHTAPWTAGREPCLLPVPRTDRKQKEIAHALNADKSTFVSTWFCVVLTERWKNALDLFPAKLGPNRDAIKELKANIYADNPDA